MKSIFETIGVLIGAIVVYKMVDKKTYFIMIVATLLSLPAGNLVRQLMQSRSISEVLDDFFTSGSHFIGVVFLWCILFSAIHFATFKRKDYLIKALSSCSIFFVISHFFNRLGCFSNGCCFGVPYSGIFSITYPSSSFAELLYGSSIPTFPSQLFESFCMVVLFIAMLKLSKTQNVFWLFQIGYGLTIIISEANIYNLGTRQLLGLSYPSILGLFLIISGVIIKIYSKRRVLCSKKLFQ